MCIFIYSNIQEKTIYHLNFYSKKLFIVKIIQARALSPGVEKAIKEQTFSMDWWLALNSASTTVEYIIA